MEFGGIPTDVYHTLLFPIQGKEEECMIHIRGESLILQSSAHWPIYQHPYYIRNATGCSVDVLDNY